MGVGVAPSCADAIVGDCEEEEEEYGLMRNWHARSAVPLFLPLSPGYYVCAVNGGIADGRGAAA